MRVVFMGTPDFAVPCLKALLEAGHEVQAVITQPDRARGRGQKLKYSPVKEAALAAGIEVLQPLRVREPEIVAKLRSIAPDIIVVVAFGQILPPQILELCPCINVHASLLPTYRGAAPIHWAVINGETRTGVTTMFMDQGLDTGDMLLKAEIAIAPSDTVGIVHDKLAELGARLLVDTLEKLPDLKRVPQNHSEASYAPLITREAELIHWESEGAGITNQIRGMNPWPGAYTTYKDRLLKIWQAEFIEGKNGKAPGTVVEVDKNRGFTVQSGDGLVLIKEVQPQGGRKMEGSAFARGYGVRVEDKLGLKED